MATKSTETFRSAESCTAAWVCSLEPHLDLRDRSDARSVLQTADCPLPNLEELSVANIKFSDGGGSSTPSLPPVDITFRLLRRCLAIRRAVCGRRLAKLTFEKCSGHINRDQARVLVEEGSVAIVIFNEV
ncbi:hypothetical protein CONPUDRAFT_82318 [Coniophora puteana RWD-64-598 SS2]|uniref:Uncharacterized protein n=1 Tax=Coniophora puteana (strain RWD-64-598) TaxID=741705 RepID=A0A5M3MRP8_CONPW|nr:uncharacterized protein CONPUDRAFT_82318 [Coniophora puteana RWD-64-598 SS2]EIW81335.1 hypothetical protein CONPUDRAFT_82318 [Coniophora puteana RWD-64-598 SS2]